MKSSKKRAQRKKKEKFQEEEEKEEAKKFVTSFAVKHKLRGSQSIELKTEKNCQLSRNFQQQQLESI